MSEKIIANQTLTGNSLSEVTGTLVGDKFALDVNLSGGSFEPGTSWNTFTKTENELTNVYEFFLDSVLVRTVTITYTDNKKCDISGGSVVNA